MEIANSVSNRLKFGDRESSLDPSMVGMIIFLMTEIMFFAGFIVALSVIWAQGTGWPPPGQPRLPLGVSLVNTLILLGSGYCLVESFRRRSRSRELFKFSLALGSIFLLVQGYEWVRMLSHGLGVSTNAYGGFFYAVIGSHALHAFAGLGILCWMYYRLNREGFEENIDNYHVPALFWFFVVAVWPFLFVSLYGS